MGQACKMHKNSPKYMKYASYNFTFCLEIGKNVKSNDNHFFCWQTFVRCMLSIRCNPILLPLLLQSYSNGNITSDTDPYDCISASRTGKGYFQNRYDYLSNAEQTIECRCICILQHATWYLSDPLTFSERNL